MTKDNPPSKPKPKPRRKHWLLRIVGAVVVLLLLIALAVQIVLWTDLPRGIVIAQIEKQLGLRVSASSLATGWLGHTRLQNVQLGLPLAKNGKMFLSVPTMEVHNSSLFSLLIGRPISVQSIELDHPHLYVWQDADGRWNLQDVAELLARVIGKKAGQQSAQTSAPTMPSVDLTNGIITITDNQNRGEDIQPLEMHGYPDSAVEWEYKLTVAPRLSIGGRLVPGGNWAHEVAIQLQDIGAWARPWMKTFPAVAVNANWRGQLSTGGAGGRLDITTFSLGARAGSLRASGGMAVDFSGGNLGIRPDNLNIEASQSGGASPAPPIKSQQRIPRILKVTLASGLLNYKAAGGQITAEPLVLGLFGGPATVSGEYNLHTRSGRIAAAWNQLALPGNVTHSGSFALSLSRPFPNKFVMEGKVSSNGNAPTGPWLATATLGANGASFTDFDWRINAPKIDWYRQGAGVNLDGLAIVGSVARETIEMRSISLPKPGLINGSASYHLTDEHAWYAHLRGQHWPFDFIQGTQLAFELRARGNIREITLEDFILKSPDIQASVNGSYRFGVPKPLKAQVSIVNAPPGAVPVAYASSNQAKILTGSIEGHAVLEGTIQPMRLSMRGGLSGREIDVRGHHLGAIALKLSDQSHVDDNGAFIYTENLQLLGGQWGLDGIYVFNSNGLDVDINIKDLNLADVATLADQADVRGRVDGRMSVFIPGLNPNPNRLRIPPSTFKLRNVNVRGEAVDEIDATIAMSNGRLQVSPIRMRRGAGRAEATIATTVNNIRQFVGGVTVSNWPVDIAGVNAHIDAWVGVPSFVINLPNARAKDPALRKLRISASQADLHASTTFRGKPLGEIIAHAGFDGRTIDLRGFNMRLLGGRVDGQAYVNLDKLEAAKAEFTWEQLDLKELALIFTQLKDLRGKLTGDARLAPATVPRPREPLAIVITSKVEGGGWRTVTFTDFRLAGYIGPNEADPEAGWRVVMEDSPTEPSFIHLAGGTVQLWGRFGSHRRGMTSTQAQLAFSNLELNDLVHAFMTDAHFMPGKLNGSIMLLRAPKPDTAPPKLALDKMFPAPPVRPVGPAHVPGPNAPPLQQLIEPLFGEGRVTLTHANLANFGPIAAIYNFMNIFQNVNVPEGHGSAQFHLERGTLTIEQMRYINRGTEIRAIATVRELWKMPDSPFNASGLGTAKPLAKVKLPFLASFSDALSAIQSSLKLTGVRVDGTLNHYHIVGPIGLTDVGDELQRIFVGDLKSNGEAGAGG